MIQLYRVSKVFPRGAEMLTILHWLDLTIPDGQFILGDRTFGQRKVDASWVDCRTR